MKPVLLVVAILLGVFTSFGQGTSKWVHFGPDHRLRYGTDARGNRIMDFSHAGYKGGGVALPLVRAAVTLQPEAGDNTARIQAAIDDVSRMPLDAGGFRGAVVLAPGTFEVAGSLSISASGVVLRGNGSGAGGTVLRMTGRPHRLLGIQGSGTWQTEGDAVAIIDSYVPSGGTWFHVKDASGFQAGDTVLVRRPVTQEWVSFMGMDNLVREGTRQTWIRPGTVITTDRRVQSVVGDRITLDVPLTDSFDARHLGPGGATIVKYRFPGRISQVGFESVRVAAIPGEGTTGEHRLMGMSAVSDAWVRDVVVEGTRDGMTISQSARRITLDRLWFHLTPTEPHRGGSSPANIAISGTQILLDRCGATGKQSWPVVTQGLVTGPIVLLDFSCDEAGFSPHQRWATGLLVDGGEFRNNWERRPGVALSNRAHAGSGHGWSAGWSVLWNVKSDYLHVDQPPGGMNWSIGSTARFTNVLWDGSPLPTPNLPSDMVESVGMPVEPKSLYLWQLRERLGETALENIGR